MRKSMSGSSGNPAAGASGIPRPRAGSVLSTPSSATKNTPASARPKSLQPPRIRSEIPRPAAENGASTLDTLRAENYALKYKLSNVEDEREREKLRFENTIRQLEQRVKDEGKRADALENDQAFLFERQKETAEELNRLKSQTSSQSTDLEKSVRTLRQKLAEAEEERDEYESTLRTLEASSRRKLDEARVRQRGVDEAVAELTARVETLTAALYEKDTALNGERDRAAALAGENKSFRARLADLDTLAAVQKELSGQLAAVKALEAKVHAYEPELERLRDEHQRHKFVVEEKAMLESRLGLMDDLRTKLAAAELEANTLRDERERWHSYLDRDDTFRTPEDVVQALGRERADKISLLDKLGRIEAENAARGQGLQEDEHERGTLRARIAELEDSLDKASKLAGRAERQRALAAKEAAFLRDQLKTYDSEETVFMQGNYDQHKAERISALEQLLAAAKDEVARVTREADATLAAAVPALGKRMRDDGADERLGELLRRNRQMQDEYAQLKQAAEGFQREAAALKKQVAAADDLRQTQARVLELRDSPLAHDQAVKRQMLDALQTENNALLAQLDGRRDDVGQSVPVATLDRLRLEIREIEKQLADREKRMRRLKEIWSAKSMEFREAVYSLLGYKLDFLPNNKVRATSMFASSDDESFTFDPDAGTMKLSGRTDSPFARECANLITFWVQERREIPCFLAALNLELYDRTTKAAAF
ncbi:spindle assembly checkpoint component Mad1 [Dipodascopsis tothii]|uniref:spindle assembly checkpoint component Mad1 n=1 Tax=Dipodascopsis tothii TaxID=44089 RepID=UPI0034CEC2E4